MRPRVSYSLSAKNAVLPLNTRITKFRRGNSNKLSFLAFAPDSLSLSLVPFQNNAGLGGSSRKVGLSAPRFSSVRCFLGVCFSCLQTRRAFLKTRRRLCVRGACLQQQVRERIGRRGVFSSAAAPNKKASSLQLF